MAEVENQPGLFIGELTLSLTLFEVDITELFPDLKKVGYRLEATDESDTYRLYRTD